MSTTEQALLEADAVIQHLNARAESDKTTLARELHDELGGLMVSAIMDLASAQLLDAEMNFAARARLDRARKSLESAIDFKRRLIEGLRPSILDNFGLFAALKWHHQDHCRHSKITCSEHYPDNEPPLLPDAGITLYRIAQEALAMTLKRGSVTSTALHVKVTSGNFSMEISDDGTPAMADGQEVGASTALASMRHRLQVFGGNVDLRRTDKGGTVLSASMPVAIDPR